MTAILSPARVILSLGVTIALFPALAADHGRRPPPGR